MDTCHLIPNRRPFIQVIQFQIFHRIMQNQETPIEQQRKEWLKPHRKFIDEIAKQITVFKQTCQATIDRSMVLLQEKIQKFGSCISFKALLKLEEQLQNIDHISPQHMVYTIQEDLNELHKSISEQQKIWQEQVCEILQYIEERSQKRLDNPIKERQPQPSKLVIASDSQDRRYVEDLFKNFQRLNDFGSQSIIPFTFSTIDKSGYSIEINYQEPTFHPMDSENTICSTLDDIVDKGQIKNECCAMDVLTKLCLAIQQLHDHKIHLGNISASNIFVTLTNEAVTRVELGLPFIKKDSKANDYITRGLSLIQMDSKDLNCDGFIELLQVKDYRFNRKLLVNVDPKILQDINSLIDITYEVMQQKKQTSIPDFINKYFAQQENNPILKSIYQQFKTKVVQTVDDLLNIIHRQRYPNYYLEEQYSEVIQQTHPLFCNKHELKLKYLVKGKEQCYLCIMDNLKAEQSFQSSGSRLQDKTNYI